MSESQNTLGLDAGAVELLKILADRVPRTRADIAELTGASRSTVFNRINALRRAALVVSVGEGSSTGGRPSTRFALNDRARTVGAIHIGSRHCTVALADLGSEILVRDRFDIELSDGPDSVLQRAADALESLVGQLSSEHGPVEVITVGVSSPIDPMTGLINNVSPMPGWSSFALQPWLQARFTAEIVVDNDATLMAIGEQAAHYAGAADLMFVTVSNGIGVGLVLANAPYAGSHGLAGDIGHLRVRRPDADIPCHCGNSGCLVAVSSTEAILRELRSRGVAAESTQDLFALVQDGDVMTAQVLRRAGRDLGDVLTACVTLLNPSVLVIGGSLAFAGDHLLAGIREMLYARSIPHIMEGLTIARTQTERDASITGAAIHGARWSLQEENITRLLSEPAT
jgi:predicted NBD/HSP70 family sugar kinase